MEKVLESRAGRFARSGAAVCRQETSEPNPSGSSRPEAVLNLGPNTSKTKPSKCNRSQYFCTLDAVRAWKPRGGVKRLKRPSMSCLNLVKMPDLSCFVVFFVLASSTEICVSWP
jgi:hypothetical protein